MHWVLFTDNILCCGMAEGYDGTREGPEDNVKGAGSSSSGGMAVPIIQPRKKKAQQLNVESDHLLVLVHGILARFVLR